MKSIIVIIILTSFAWAAKTNTLSKIDTSLKTKQCSLLIAHQDSVLAAKEKEERERLIKLILEQQKELKRINR